MAKTSGYSGTYPLKSLGNSKFWFLLILINFVLLAALYLAYVTYRSVPIYSYFKKSQRGWRGHVHQADPQLGYAPIPNATGAHIFPLGPEIPMRYDSNGFRVPVEQDPSAAWQKTPLLLTLGCSFTYGDAMPAEETWPYLLGELMAGHTLNAGVCGYSLAQMLIRARELVPRYLPDYLIVQYSPWLVERAVSPFGPTYYGKLPVPFFYVQDGLIAIYPPVFQWGAAELPTDYFRNSKKSASDFVSFVYRVGLPLYCHDHWGMLRYYLGKVTGELPSPAQDQGAVEKYVYAELVKLCNQQGVKLVIVVLGQDSKAVEVPAYMRSKDSLVIDAHAELLSKLAQKTMLDYGRAYFIRRGDPPQVVDQHPNSLAHQIIAAGVARQLTNEVSPWFNPGRQSQRDYSH